MNTIARALFLLSFILFAPSLKAQELVDTIGVRLPSIELPKASLMQVEKAKLELELPRNLQDFALPEMDRLASTLRIDNPFDARRSKSFVYSKNLRLDMQSKHYSQPGMQVDAAAARLLWQASPSLSFWGDARMALGQDLLLGVRKDYGFAGGMQARLNPKLGVSAEADWSRVFGIAPTARLAATMHYKPLDNLQVNTGLSYYNSAIGGQFGQALRFNSDVRFELIDNLTLRGFGGYSVYNKQPIFNPMMPFLANYGGALELRVSDRFGVGVGMEREYNIWTRRWEERYFAYPIFYGDKK